MTVDAVFAMAHALHRTIKEYCNDTEFSQCESFHSNSVGADLLRAIRDVSFIGMQGTQVRISKYSSYAIITNDKNNTKLIHMFMLFI